MTNKEVISFLDQVRKIILDDKSWLESTTQPINEAFDIAISALQAQNLQPTCNQLTTDTISEQSSCVYCHEDSDGYITPLEKNCHAFVMHSPIHGWILSIKYGAWRKDIPIRFCPVCGRELKNG